MLICFILLSPLTIYYTLRGAAQDSTFRWLLSAGTTWVHQSFAPGTGLRKGRKGDRRIFLKAIAGGRGSLVPEECVCPLSPFSLNARRDPVSRVPDSARWQTETQCGEGFLGTSPRRKLGKNQGVCCAGGPRRGEFPLGGCVVPLEACGADCQA